MLAANGQQATGQFARIAVVLASKHGTFLVSMVRLVTANRGQDQNPTKPEAASVQMDASGQKDLGVDAPMFAARACSFV